MAKSSRRPFGSVFSQAGKPGFYIQFSWQGKKYRRVGGKTRGRAKQKLAVIHHMLEKGILIDKVKAEVFGETTDDRVSFRSIAPDYLEYAETRKKASTFGVDKTRLRVLCETPWAAKLLSEIRPEDLVRWADQRHARGASGPSVNRYLALASALFRWAIRMGYAESNPVRRVEKFPETGRGRETYLTAEEARALVEAVESSFRPLVATALHTGMRRGELLALRWRSVDFQRGEITVEPESAKTGKARTIPMTATLERELVSLRRAKKVVKPDGSDPVFALQDRSPLTKWKVQSRMGKAVQRCKTIPDEKKGKVTFHTLRHTAASLMAQAGVSLFDVAKILGHSSTIVTMRYAHFFPNGARSAVDRLDQALGGARA